MHQAAAAAFSIDRAGRLCAMRAGSIQGEKPAHRIIFAHLDDLNFSPFLGQHLIDKDHHIPNPAYPLSFLGQGGNGDLMNLVFL